MWPPESWTMNTSRVHAIPCPTAQAGPGGALEGPLVTDDGRTPVAAVGKQDSPAKMPARNGPR